MEEPGAFDWPTRCCRKEEGCCRAVALPSDPAPPGRPPAASTSSGLAWRQIMVRAAPGRRNGHPARLRTETLRGESPPSGGVSATPALAGVSPFLTCHPASVFPRRMTQIAYLVPRGPRTPARPRPTDRSQGTRSESPGPSAGSQPDRRGDRAVRLQGKTPGSAWRSRDVNMDFYALRRVRFTEVQFPKSSGRLLLPTCSSAAPAACSRRQESCRASLAQSSTRIENFLGLVHKPDP